MEDKYYQVILEKYRNKETDFSGLFQAVLAIADEIGLEKSLEYLEKCVIEKRLAWLDGNLDKIEKTGNAVEDGYRIFYEKYLGISVPKGREVVGKTNTIMASVRIFTCYEREWENKRCQVA